jgi:hypothetical protein
MNMLDKTTKISHKKGDLKGGDLMEIQGTATVNKDQISKAFQQLLSVRKHVTPKIATKQETAERAEDKNVVERASTYTVESIVKGLADLQLNFGRAVDSLAGQLSVEAPKLDELRRAIRVETQYVEELRNVRIAADALDMLIQEHQEKTKAFEETAQQEHQTLDREIAEAKQTWQKEQQEFEVTLKERQELLKKERKRNETDYQYELDRKRKIEADDYANRRAGLERQIAEEDAKRGIDWVEREKILAEQQETLKKYKALVESFPQELEETIRKAREEAIQEVHEEARVQAELFEKEVVANKEVYELQLASLKDTIEHQSKQIEYLSAQLQTALKQVQDLAAKAVESTGRSGKMSSGETIVRDA